MSVVLEEIFNDNIELSRYLHDVSERYNKLTSIPFDWVDFSYDLLNTLAKDSDPLNNVLVGGPITINICPEEDELLKCKTLEDMKPVRQIKFDKYPVIELNSPERSYKLPIWVSSTQKEIKFDYSWENKKRFNLSTFSLGDLTPHSFLGGSTGSGKSVCNNSLICDALLRYAPWELQVYMSDAKKVEFSRYSLENKNGESYTMPHIRCVAAAEDQSYAITMIEYLNELANKRQKIFAKIGVQNIKDFRKVTKLSMPRILIALEEVQFMFSKVTPKEKTKIMDMLDQFGTASRNTGIHLHLTSQSVGDISKEVLKNIGLRGALKSTPDVSKKIIRNYEASTIKTFGYLFVNNSEIDKDEESKKLNKSFKVPYQIDSEFEEVKFRLAEVGEQFGYKQDCIYYKEGVIYDRDYLYEDFGYNPITGEIDNSKAVMDLNPNKIYFGIRGSFKKDSEPNECIEFKGNFGENLLIFSENNDGFNRQLEFIKFQLENLPKIQFNKNNKGRVFCNVALGKPSDREDLKLPNNSSITEFNSDFISQYSSMLAIIVANIEMNKIFERTDAYDNLEKSLEDSIGFFTRSREMYNTIIDYLESVNGTLSTLEKLRIVKYAQVINNNPSILKILGRRERDTIDTLSFTKDNYHSSMKMFNEYISITRLFYGDTERITLENTPVLYVIITSLNEIPGIQIGEELSIKDNLVNLMSFSSKANCHFIVLTSLDNRLKNFVSVSEYALFTRMGKDLLERFNSKLSSGSPMLPEGVCAIYNTKTGDIKKFLEFKLEKDLE